MANEKENTLKVDIPLWVKAIPVLGLGAGLFYAWKKKKSVMGYVGYGLLGGFVGGVIATPIAIKKGAKAIGDNLVGQMKDGVSKMSTPNSTPVSTPAPNTATVKLNREEMLKKLTQPTGGNVEGGSMSVSIDKSFYKNFTDRELEVMIAMGEIEKNAKSETDAKNIMKQKGISEVDLKNIGEKMKNAFQGK